MAKTHIRPDTVLCVCNPSTPIEGEGGDTESPESRTSLRYTVSRDEEEVDRGWGGVGGVKKDRRQRTIIWSHDL